MNDEISNDLYEFLRALKDFGEEPNDQFTKYLSELLHSIPILCLWDTCILFAKDLFYQQSVPNVIKQKKYVLSEIEPNSEKEKELLTPIQKWISDEVIKSIDNKEIIPKITGKFLDGKIDPRRTYVHMEQIKDWFFHRGINSAPYTSFFDSSFYNFYTHALDFILYELSLLPARAYNSDIDIPTLNSEDRHKFIIEIARLRAQKNQQTNRQLPPKKKHGNTEINAQKRVEILGAALAVTTKWEKLCKNNKGAFEATKIGQLIDQKAPLFWRDTGEPPLSKDCIIDLIREWLKKVNNSAE